MADHGHAGRDADAGALIETTAERAAAGPTSAGVGRRLLGRAENPLVRAVGRIPAGVHAKLLVAFAGIAFLLVVVGVLGLRVLGQSNGRVERLGDLQLRAATYQNLQSQAQQVRQLLAVRVGADPNNQRYAGNNNTRLAGRARWVLADKITQTSLALLGPAANESRFGFAPSPQEEELLTRIHKDFNTLSATLERMVAVDQTDAKNENKSQPLQTKAIDADNDLSDATDTLASRTRDQTDGVIAQNRSSYLSSRNLFIGVGSGAVALALGLGFLLSWSLIGPIRRTEERLAEIAAGDFSAHVDVTNRDELGSLATNVNRMNDELGRLYGELETVSRHKSEFLANMSHELRTPLNAIIGFSEVLQQEMFGELNEQQAGYVGDVLTAGKHLLALINDILDLSKIEAGRMELELSDVQLAETLRSGITMNGERASRAGVALGLSVEPEDLDIRADERKVRQVVFNLLSNAIKFTPAGGRVNVSARLDTDVVEVAVTDTGTGISPEDQELIFEEFGQARGAEAAKRQEGTGLGLPLSRRFVELHGGRLWVESVEGEGSAFRFTLPVTQPEEDPWPTS